jgi:hypothetical protein
MTTPEPWQESRGGTGTGTAGALYEQVAHIAQELEAAELRGLRTSQRGAVHDRRQQSELRRDLYEALRLIDGFLKTLHVSYRRFQGASRLASLASQTHVPPSGTGAVARAAKSTASHKKKRGKSAQRRCTARAAPATVGCIRTYSGTELQPNLPRNVTVCHTH